MQQQTTGRAASNLADRVRQTAGRHPDRAALHWRDQTLTWSELDAAVDGVALALTRAVPAPDPAGGTPPARVAVALPNCPDFVLGYLGALRAGLVVVPLNPGLTAAELGHALADSGAALLIATPAVADRVAGIAAELPALTAVHTSVPTVSGAGQPQPSTRAGDDLAVLLYTSGTEGRPKGAMLSHRALTANHHQIDRITPPVVGADDTVLLALPLFHAYGLNTGLGSVLYHGATGVLVDEFSTGEVLDDIARHRVSVLLGVPSMFQAWAQAGQRAATAMATVRLAVCGAAPLPPAVATEYAAVTGHPVHVGYGLTETAPVLTATLGGVPKPGSIGRPLPGVGVRLVAPDGTDLWRDGTPVAVDDSDEMDLDVSSPGTDPGQVVVRGENLFSGYWPDGRGGPAADGWWATGDVAYADADGDLFLVDRLREVILVNGFNVYPHEVELVLGAHPAVAESAVLGVPDPRTGEAVRAYVVRRPTGTVGAEELLAHCARRLARFKCPTSVEFVDALPYSAIGKVRKTLLRPPAVSTEVRDVR